MTAGDRPAWVETIESCRNTSGPGLVALCRLLDDDSSPPALRELARRFVEARLYRADRPRARTGDPETSKSAARRVAGRVRPGGAVHKILRAYEAALPSHPTPADGDPFGVYGGLTSREVEDLAGVRGAHKRVSELDADGLLEVLVAIDDEGAHDVVRDGGRVLRITRDGREELARLDGEEANR